MDELTQRIAGNADLTVERFSPISPGPLDYSEHSLEHIEWLLNDASQHELMDADIKEIVQIMGCYLLEVGRRNRGGQYSWFEQRHQPVLVVEGEGWRVAMMTFDKVEGRLRGEEADNIPFFYGGFAERASSATPGTDAFYV